MEDYEIEEYMTEDYTVQGLESRVQKLSMSNESEVDYPKQSLVADPVFQDYYRSVQELDGNGRSRFLKVLVFEESLNLYALIDNDSKIFLEVVRASEPGRPLSYISLQADLEKVQDEIQGGDAVIQEMFDFMDQLSTKHRHFVYTSCALTMIELYHKIVLRQYGIVDDPQFLALKELQVPAYEETFHEEAPPYTTVKARLDGTLSYLQSQLDHAAQDVANIKNSLEFKKFRAKLTTAQQLYQAKEQKAARAIERENREAYLKFFQRVAEVRANTEKVQERRAKKNLHTKSINIENLRQLGNQSRTPLPQSVVDALSTVQTSHNDTVFGELLAGQEKAKQDSDTQEVNEGNLHNVVEQVTITAQPADFHEESLQDIEVAEGFENIAK